MDWKTVLTELSPTIVSAVVSVIGFVVLLLRTSVNSICNRINKNSSVIQRSSVTDPKDYYKVDPNLQNVRLLYKGQEIPIEEVTFVKK